MIADTNAAILINNDKQKDRSQDRFVGKDYRKPLYQYFFERTPNPEAEPSRYRQFAWPERRNRWPTDYFSGRILTRVQASKNNK